MARRHSKGGGNHLEQESNRQNTMKGIDGGLHPALDGQSLDEERNTEIQDGQSLDEERNTEILDGQSLGEG